MNKIIFIIILFSIISLNLFGKYKYEDFYKTVDLSKCKNTLEMLYILENYHNLGRAMNSTPLYKLTVKISDYIDYYYYRIGAYKYLINYYKTGDEYTKELMQDIYKVCSNFRISGVTSYKENKGYTSYEFAALLFNNSKEYTVDDYMDILNFGYGENILNREYLLNYLRDRYNFFLEGTHYYLNIFPITIEYKGKTIPKVTDSLTEFYYNFYGTKFKVEKIIIKENDTWVDIYNKYGDTGIIEGSDYKLVGEIESYKSKTSNYYERLNDITNYFNDKNNIIFTNFNFYMTNQYYEKYYHEYYDQFDVVQDMKIEDGNYYEQLENLESKIKEIKSRIGKNISSIKELQYDNNKRRGYIEYDKSQIEIYKNKEDEHSKMAVDDWNFAIASSEEIIIKNEKEIEKILKDIKNLEVEFEKLLEKLKKEALKKWLEYKFQNERIEYLTIPEEFIGKYFYILN